MTDTVLIAGTASHAGKSTLAAGLCRLLARRGVSVAPYKAQNMSNNARVALTPDGDWGEIGVSQHVQARAAEVPATTDMNPVLLKPRGDGESQLIVDGEAVANASAGDYYESHWEDARAAAYAIVASVTDMAHRVNARVIGEGIETVEHEDRMRALGVDMAQGYRYGAPWPAADVEDGLRELHRVSANGLNGLRKASARG